MGRGKRRRVREHSFGTRFLGDYFCREEREEKKEKSRAGKGIQEKRGKIMTTNKAEKDTGVIEKSGGYRKVTWISVRKQRGCLTYGAAISDVPVPILSLCNAASFFVPVNHCLIRERKRIEDADTIIQGAVRAHAERGACRVMVSMSDDMRDSRLDSGKVLDYCDVAEYYVPRHHPLIVSRLNIENACGIIQGVINGTSSRRALGVAYSTAMVALPSTSPELHALNKKPPPVLLLGDGGDNIPDILSSMSLREKGEIYANLSVQERADALSAMTTEERAAMIEMLPEKAAKEAYQAMSPSERAALLELTGDEGLQDQALIESTKPTTVSSLFKGKQIRNKAARSAGRVTIDRIRAKKVRREREMEMREDGGAQDDRFRSESENSSDISEGEYTYMYLQGGKGASSTSEATFGLQKLSTGCFKIYEKNILLNTSLNHPN